MLEPEEDGWGVDAPAEGGVSHNLSYATKNDSLTQAKGLHPHVAPIRPIAREFEPIVRNATCLKKERARPGDAIMI